MMTYERGDPYKLFGAYNRNCIVNTSEMSIRWSDFCCTDKYDIPEQWVVSY